MLDFENRTKGRRISMDEMKALLNAILERLDVQGAKIDNLQTDVNRLHGRMSALEDRMDKLENRMDELENRMDKLENRMDKLENRIDALEHEVHDLRLEVLDSRYDLVRRVRRQEGHLHMLDEELTAVQKRVKELEHARA